MTTPTAYVEREATLPFTRNGKHYPASVSKTYWRAVVYGAEAVRVCPLQAFAAACERWLDCRAQGHDPWGQAFVGDVMHAQGGVAPVVAWWGRVAEKRDEDNQFKLFDRKDLHLPPKKMCENRESGITAW